MLKMDSEGIVYIYLLVMEEERVSRREQRRRTTEVREDGRCRRWAGAIEVETGFG